MPVNDIQKRIRRFPWAFFFGIVVFVMFASAGAVFGLARWMDNDLPPIENLQTYRPALKSSVYDVRNRLVHEFFRENRQSLRLAEIPPSLVQATIATEDKRFYQHWGIDVFGILRAAAVNLTRGERAQGASTITQQLARNMFLTHERSWQRKMKEALLAMRIERVHSKHEILELYFNQIYYGDGSYGVASAARNFFGRPASQLKLEEAALLAGLPANPAGYSPRRHPEAAKNRRDHVLRRMYEEKIITGEQYRRTVALPLGVTAERFVANSAPYFVEMVRQYMDEKYGSNLLYEGGLKIYTSLDLDLQTVAERSLEKHLSALEARNGYAVTRANFARPAGGAAPATRTPYLQGAVLALDPRTGYVRALAGGRSFADSPFNRAVQAQRQPGSAFKPFIYTAAIDHLGYKPTDVVVDAPVTYAAGGGGVWTPSNYDGGFSGPVTLRYALQKSINIPAIKLLGKVGTTTVSSYARLMGIKSPIGQNLSLALGTSEVNLLELVSAYGVLADQGIRTEPLFILKVEDAEGNVMETNPPRPTDVLSSETAAVMTSMLQSVVDHGTGYPARAMGLTAPAAGKTGTTDDFTDAWFVGYTPSLVCGTWVGFDVKRPLGKGMTGAVAALPVWTDVMRAWTVNRPVEYFDLPTGTVTREICTETGLLATDACPEVTTEVFTAGTEPQEVCSVHVGLPRQPGEPGQPGQPPAPPGATPAAAPGQAKPRQEDFRTLDRRTLQPERPRI
jgi:penicillin-binding protein 1A